MQPAVVIVRYFAALREQRGCTEEPIPVRPGETVEALYARLFAPPRLPVMFAVDQGYVPAGHVLQGGEEVAFIPPLGGG